MKGETTNNRDKEKHQDKCPKCNSTYVKPKPQMWAPEGKTMVICGICEDWWYEPKP
jgi:hypothetical protein